MHQQMAGTMDTVIGEMRGIQDEARAAGITSGARGR